MSIPDKVAKKTFKQKTSNLMFSSNKSIEQLADNRQVLAPLTSAQQRMWFAYVLDNNNIAYNRPVGIKIKGNLQLQMLENTLDLITQRHQVLRTTFSNKDGNPIQKVSPALKYSIQFSDYSCYSRREAENRLDDFIQTQARHPFNLETGPLLRPYLIRLHEEEHFLFLVIHEIIFDYSSTRILLQEMVTTYANLLLQEPVALPPLFMQYGDYAYQQQESIKQPIIKTQLEYWKKQLSGELPVLEIPTDRLRPATSSFGGANHFFKIEENIATELKGIAERNEISLYTTLLAAFYTLLYRYTAQEDIIIGTPVTTRKPGETERLIGSFRNMLALRQQVNGDETFIELLYGVQRTSESAASNQAVPFEKVVEEIIPERTVARPPVYQVLFSLNNAIGTPLQSNNIQFEYSDLRTGITDFDLFLEIITDNNELRCVFEYDTDLFNEDTIGRMEGHFRTLLESIIMNPYLKISQLPLLPESEKKVLINDWNQTQLSYPDNSCVHELFEQQVRKTPDAIALIFEDEQLTYTELNSRANQLANYLVSRGIKEDTLVPLCIERSVEMIVGLLGILKAGAAYVPVDPAFPRDRIQFMLEDAASSLIVSSSSCAFLVEANDEREIILLDRDWVKITEQPATNVEKQLQTHFLAYSIFTSGSTGRPKGVMIQHQSLVNFLISMIDQLEVKPDLSLLSVTTFSFDIFYLELYVPLLVGGKIILATKETASDGYLLQQKLAKHCPSVMQATPATWQMLLDSGWENKEEITILLGGEAVREALKESLTGISHKVWDLYGPTETTIWSTSKELKKGERITIGKPIANTQVYILDKSGAPTPIGIPGELCIGGDGLARGYLKRADLTAERFIPNPFSKKPDAKLYRTGDLARWLSTGEIEYLSRMDDQVKIRGYRIELGEIENRLQQCKLVRKGVVIAKEDTSGSKRLIGYVVPEGVFNKESILAELREALPEYMVPSLLISLTEFPLTPNGKVNKKALPDPKQFLQVRDEYVAPETEAEQTLADIWAQILGQELVGTHDNFFELGGHSLLAVKLVAAIKNKTGRELPVSVLYSNPIIAKLAKHIDGEIDTNIWSPLVPIQTGAGKQPLFLIHHGGGGLEYAQRIALFLNKDQTVYGIQPIGLNGKDEPLRSVEEMANHYLTLIEKTQPEGPYNLGGYSTGGYVAYEIANRLKNQGKIVENLFLFDVYPNSLRFTYQNISLIYILWSTIKLFTSFEKIKHFYATKGWLKTIHELKNLIKVYFPKTNKVLTSVSYKKSSLARLDNVNTINSNPEIRSKFLDINHKAEKKYKLKPYLGKMVFIRAIENHAQYLREFHFGWKKFVLGTLKIYDVSGDHNTMFDDTDNAKNIAAVLQNHLKQSE